MANKFLDEKGLAHLWACILKEIDESQNPRDNLLINSDFRYGAINQRGKTSYSNASVSVYGIDAWKTNGLQVLSNSVKLTKVKEHLLMWQAFRLTGADIYTLTFKARANRTLRGEVYETGRTFDITTSWKIISVNFKASEIPSSGKYTTEDMICYVGAKWAVVNGSTQNLSSTDWVEVEWVKLEEGNEYTGMPVWNYAEELIKCYRLYVKYRFLTGFVSGKYLFVCEKLPVQMRITPTLQIGDILTSAVESTGAVSAEILLNDRELINIKADKTLSGTFNFLKEVELDAGFY